MQTFWMLLQKKFHTHCDADSWLYVLDLIERIIYAWQFYVTCVICSCQMTETRYFWLGFDLYECTLIISVCIWDDATISFLPRIFTKGPKYSWSWICAIDTFQDLLIPEHIKNRLHKLEISIFSQKCVIVRPTQTPKSADKKSQFLTFKVNFLCQKLSKCFYFFSIE